MSLATLARSWHGRPVTTTVRQFSLAVAFAVLAVGAGAAVYAAEKWFLGLDRQFVENPASAMMRAVGLAHFWVGWLFLFTSPRLRNPRACTRLFGLTALGALLCWAAYVSGAVHTPLGYLVFYGYFLLHEIRDQANLYQASGDLPAVTPADRRVVGAMRDAAAVVLVGFAACGYLGYGLLVKNHPDLVAFARAWYALGLLVLMASGLWFARRAWRAGREAYGSAAAALDRHRPLATVYGGIFAILLLGLAAGGASLNLIILIHTGSWLVFVSRQLSRQPPRPVRGLWGVLRHTPAGFLTLHLGVIVAVLLLMALRVHLWQRAGLASELLTTSSFPYWSLMHITMSFWQPPR